MLDYKVKIGLAPLRRQLADEATRKGIFEPAKAKESKDKVIAYIKENFSDNKTEFVDLEWLNDEGLLSRTSQCAAIKEAFTKQGVDAIFLINCNFGSEEAAGQMAKMMNLPVLLWGPQDMVFEENGQRYTDAQCGLFAISKQLRRLNVPFSYIENCRIEEDIFKEGLEQFLSVVCMVKNFKALKVTQVGTRLNPFKSVMSNELEITEKFGINVYGATEICADLKKVIAAHSSKTDTLLFLGKDAIYKSCKSAKRAIELLEKAGISFTVLENEPDSGYAMNFLVGAADETKKIMENCAKSLDFKTIIAYDPADAKTFIRDYKEWGISLGADVDTYTSFVAGLIKDGKLKPKKSGMNCTIQDNHNLSRELEEFEPTREIISACAKVKEMLLYNKDTMLAGNLIMNEYMPDVMKKVAHDRVINAENVDAEVIVTQSPAEYELLSADGGIRVMSVEEVVLQCLSD